MKLNPTLILIFCFLVVQTMLLAQEDIANPGFGDLQIDTSYSSTDTVNNKLNRWGMFSIFKGTPGKAALIGLLIPSGGQFYNRKYWKVPLALGIEGAVWYNLIANTQKFNEWDQALMLFNNNEINQYKGLSSASQIARIRNGYRRNKEFGIIIGVGGHLLTVIEAFVDRHLIEFDISDDLTIGSGFSQSNQALAYGIFYQF